MKLSELEYFFVDIDRTLVQWKRPVIGSQDFIHTLKEEDKRVVYHSDNTLFTRKEIAEKLNSIDIPSGESKVMTSGYVAADYLSKKGVKSVYVVGERALVEEVKKRGIDVSRNAETVLVGMDRQFNYEKLRVAAEIAQEGDLYVCSTEKMLGSDRFRPHQLAINRALETFSESELLGKPSDVFADSLRKLTYEPDKTLMIGDRMADIELGKKLGLNTALVTSGEADVRDLKGLEPEDQPDCVVSSLPKLTERIV